VIFYLWDGVEEKAIGVSVGDEDAEEEGG